MRSDKVVIVGHSAGGLVVAGYPGQYHDVAAMIQADISASKPTTPAPGGGFNPQPGHVDYFQFFQTRQDCETFNAFEPGVVKYVLNIACAPPFVLTPVGEITGLDQAYADNATYIPKIGPRIPVLLTSGARGHDRPAPSSPKRFRLLPVALPLLGLAVRARATRVTCSWPTSRFPPGSSTSSHS